MPVAAPSAVALGSRRRWSRSSRAAWSERRRHERAAVAARATIDGRSARRPAIARRRPSASGSPRARATRSTRSTEVSNAVAFEIARVPAPKSVAVGFDSVWAVSKAADALYRLDPLEGDEPLEIPLGEGADPSDVAVDEHWVWVAERRRAERGPDRPEDERARRQRPARHRAALDRDRRRARSG